MNTRRAIGAALGAVLAVAAWRGAWAGEAVFCATLLTAAELGAISPGSEAMAPIVRGEGHSECSWTVQGVGNYNTMSLTFWEPRAMKDFIVPADTPEEFFEMLVQSAEQARSAKREVLKGVGLRSALFRDGAQRAVFVQTRVGVAHLVIDGLSDEQINAVAKAVATP